MEITEVRIKLTEDSDDRLQAFCSITFDDSFVVRDLKIIEGINGPFVAMPSRKLTSHCPRCGCKNHLRAGYCNQCGGKLNPDRATRDQDGRAKLYADIAHPVNSRCREQIQERVVATYLKERELARQPGYVSRYDDAYEDEFTGADFADVAPPASAPRPASPSPKNLADSTEAPPVSIPAEPIQRTDATPAAVQPPAPHLGAKPLAPSASGSGSRTAGRPTRGFGAGILDD